MAANPEKDKSTGAGGATPANAAPGGVGPDAAAAAKANQATVQARVELGSDVAAPVDPAKNARNNLIARAQVRAPSLTPEFVDYHDLPDEYLEAIAAGVEPPPPVNGPNPSTHLHFTPGGWQVTPLGVSPEEVDLGKGGYGPLGPSAIARFDDES